MKYYKIDMDYLEEKTLNILDARYIIRKIKNLPML